MREIKVRVFNKANKEMYYLLKDRWSFGPSEGIRAVSWEDVFAAQEPELLPLEYTGLKDKKGKEIYEGDILQCHEGGIHFNEDDFEIKIVKWNMFGWMPFIYREGRWVSYYGEIKEFKVIGNIYENPELLEQST